MTLCGGSHVNTAAAVERIMKWKILGCIAAASGVGTKSEENKTEVSFQSCRKKTSDLEMTTGERQTKIQVILYAKSRTPHTVATQLLT
jgi:hypothetical protein